MPDEKKERRGRKRLPPEEKRSVQVKCQLTPGEAADLDAGKPEGMTRGEWLRIKALARELPRAIPPVNVKALVELSRIGNNLNQLAKGLNESGTVDQGQALAEIRELRKALQGIQEQGADDNESR